MIKEEYLAQLFTGLSSYVNMGTPPTAGEGFKKTFIKNAEKAFDVYTALSNFYILEDMPSTNLLMFEKYSPKLYINSNINDELLNIMMEELDCESR